MTRPVTRHQQRRLDWLQTSVDIGWSGPVNLARRVYLVDGPLDHDALTHAGHRLALRHSILRSTYHRVHGGIWNATIGHSIDLDITIWPETTSGDPARAADQVWQNQEPFSPTASPRFRLHLIPIGTCTVLMVVADRLVTDDISIATLTADLAATYNSIVAGHMPSCQVDERWWEYLTPSTTAPAAGRGVPMHWLELAGQMATKGAHAEVDLPLARPIDEHPDTLEAVTTTVPWPAAAVPAPALICAIARPILACTGTPAWIYLYPDRRPPGHSGAIGPYTARTLIQIPPRGDRSEAEQLALVTQRYDEATGPGVAWTELIHDRAGSNHTPPRHPSIAITHAAPPATLDIDGASTTELPTRTVDLGPGRIVFEISENALAVHHERGRYPPALIESLASEAATSLAALHPRAGTYVNRSRS